ncbi:ABC transporter permease, partial [Rhodococcus sp. C26F]
MSNTPAPTAGDAGSPDSSVHPDEGRSPWIKLVALVVGITAVVAVMLVAFALPAVNGGPHHMELGVVGPPPAVDALGANLDADQWEIVRFDSPDALTAAIENRQAAGGLALGPDGVQVYTASAGGAGAAAAIGA